MAHKSVSNLSDSEYLKTEKVYEFKVFDAHFHIINPLFPLIANSNYLPEPFTVDDYRKQTGWLNIEAGAVVSGSFQGYDQSYLLDTLENLGTSFCGVTQIPITTSDDEILRLNRGGVRAVRFNLQRGGSEELKHLNQMARRVYELANWHVELYIDSRELTAIFDTLALLPKVSVDHLGLSNAGFPTLLKLAELGVKVKATGFGRVDFDVSTALKRLYDVNPECLMFGTDLPCTRAPRPFSVEDFQTVIDTLGDDGAANVLYKNAVNFYRK